MTLATISKDFEFSASHRLEGLEPDHPCGRMHGHNYVVRLTIDGIVGDQGFVVDYRRLASFKRLVDERLDHHHLNDVIPGLQPTAEYLATWLLHEALRILAAMPEAHRVSGVTVSVSETPKTWATATQSGTGLRRPDISQPHEEWRP